MIVYHWATGYFAPEYWATGYWQYLVTPTATPMPQGPGYWQWLANQQWAQEWTQELDDEMVIILSAVAIHDKH
jgi:hypothetical protein